MNILIIFNKYEYRGGEDTYVNSLIKLLQLNGHQVKTYIKDSRNINNVFDLIRTGIGLFINKRTEKELTNVINNFKPDIAHFHNIYPLISPTAYRVCKKNNIPIIQTIHNYKFICPKNSLFRKGTICERCVDKNILWPSILYGCYHHSRLASLIYGCAFFFHKSINTFSYIDKYIFPTEFVRDYYCKHISFIPRKKTITLPYPVPLTPKRIESSRDNGNAPYAFFGRLSEEKGIMSLIQLFKMNKKNLLIMGSGPLEKTLKKECAPYSNIRFISHSSPIQVKKAMKNAKAVIIPSLWYEVLPLVLLEALALGKMIFLSQNRNLSHIKHRNNVIYFKSNDSLDLGKKIMAFEMAVKHPKVAQMPKIYSSEYHYEELKKIYEKFT